MFDAGHYVGDYKLLIRLGGSFGEVWLASNRFRLGSPPVVLKLSSDSTNLKFLRRELAIWRRLGQHQNVLQIIETFEYENCLVVVTEHVVNGNLAAWLNVRHDRRIPPQQAVALITGILSGIEHLHAQHILHLDLKPSNILIQNERPIICDFGFSVDIKERGRTSTTIAGTRPYSAPESFRGEYSFQSDIWSVGMVFLEILTGQKHCRAQSYQEFLTSLETRSFWLSGVPDHLKNVLETSLQPESSKRYSSAITMRNAIYQAASKICENRRVDSMSYTARIARDNPSCFVCLIDQSGSMDDPIRGGNGKKKCDAAADAINKILHDLTIKCTKSEGTRNYFDLAVIGYGAKVHSAFVGNLAGEGFVTISEVAKSPLRIEEREKEMPDGAGGIMKQTVKFPVWFDSVARNGTPLDEALDMTYDIVTDWIRTHKNSYPPTVINITDGETPDCRTEAEKIKSLTTSDGNVLLFNCHISDAAEATSILFPAFPDDEDKLPNDFAAMLCEMSSVLPAKIRQIARDEGFDIPEQARGFVYNADLLDLIRFLDIGSPISNAFDLR
jgi:serine/threonine protein kinase